MQKAKLLSVLICVLLPLLGAGSNWVMAQGTTTVVEGKSAPVYRNDVLGVSLRALPAGTRVVEDQYLADDFGFTLVDSDGRMVLRVAWRHRDAPSQIELRVLKLIREFPGWQFGVEQVLVDGYRGVMVDSVPGMDPSAYVYVAADGRLYEIICPQQEEKENLWGCARLLYQLSFEEPSRLLEDLQLTLAEDALYDKPPLLEFPQPKGPGGRIFFLWQKAKALLGILHP